MRQTDLLAEAIHPLALFQIHEQGAAGIAHVGAVALTGGELPEQPAFNRAKAEVTVFCCGCRCSVMVQQPLDLAGAEVGIQEQPRALPPIGLEALGLPLLAKVGRASVLPHQGWAAGDPVTAAPQHRGFTLVCDATANNGLPLFRRQMGVQLGHRLPLALPDRLRILFNPAICWVVNREWC